MKYKYKNSILGGTFDHFHEGHRSLIDHAFESSQYVSIGIATSDLYYKKNLSHVIESLATRRESLISYLKSKSFLDHAKIIEINDIYGNSLDESDIDAIFATDDNLANVKKINKKRAEKGFGSLEIEIVPHVMATDGQIISSERIRKGEIDRLGNAYFDLFATQKKYILPIELRARLKKPMGKVVKNPNNMRGNDEKNMQIAIGDMVSIQLLKAGNQADVSIIDHRTQRNEISNSDLKILSDLKGTVQEVTNEAGVIERRAVGAIRKAVTEFQKTGKKQVIQVKGEEDLLTIPVVLLSPLGSLVIYGQMNQGAVVTRISEKKKEEVRKIFEDFV